MNLPKQNHPKLANLSIEKLINNFCIFVRRNPFKYCLH